MPFCGADLLCVCMDFAEWLFSSSAYWKEMNGLFMPVHLFLYLRTMEKLQLYIPAQV